MLWEKKISSNETRGYLYIRETHYVRDRRTLKRKSPIYGDGSAYKQRGKYSKKKDIYCGRILDNIELVHLIPFSEYVEKEFAKDFLEYRTKIDFFQLIDDFVSYLLYIHELDEHEFYNGKKKAYELSSGYLCRQTIERVKEFEPKSSQINHKELESFANRCLDAGIYDEEIIMLLYSKLLPQESLRELDEEYKMDSQSHSGLRDFLKKHYERDY